MRSFQEYISEQEEIALSEELLSEDAAAIVAGILAIPTIAALGAWGASIAAGAYYKFLSSTVDKTVKIWKKIFSDFKSRITKERVAENIRDMAHDPKVRKQMQETEKNKRIYEDELKEVYSAIDSKDFEGAKKAFNQVPKELQNNPDVYKVIIAEVSRVLKEPPLYVSSPGNKTYQAIKKIINIRVARAAAMATKMAIEKNLRNDDVKQMEQEVNTESS